MPRKYHTVLTIAGSDSSGGAGIQADLKTFSCLGCYGLTVVAALTAQNTLGVTSVCPVPASFVTDQLEAIFSDIQVDAVKIGMLYSADVVETVARQIKKHPVQNIVFDPVMVSQSGAHLLQGEAIEAVKRFLMPLAHVITPNISEASVLLNQPIRTLSDMRDAARLLSSCCDGSTLLTGGHLPGFDCTDLLFIPRENKLLEFKGKRISTRNDHGTGCTLSSAIASFLAKGLTLEESVGEAKKYLAEAIQAGSDYEIGTGRGPLHHFYRMWGS